MGYCNKCGTQNREGAKFCRNCGCSLDGMETSIIDRFPEYAFEPVSIEIETNNGAKRYWICFLFFALISIGSMFGLIWVIIKSLFRCYIGEIIGMSTLAVLTIISILIARKNYHKARKLSLLSQYDYIECNNDAHLYRFVIKDTKFGLLNVKTKKEQIPCEYDYLKWKVKDKILMATLNGNHFGIDINGNKLK